MGAKESKGRRIIIVTALDEIDFFCNQEMYQVLILRIFCYGTEPLGNHVARSNSRELIERNVFIKNPAQFLKKALDILVLTKCQFVIMFPDDVGKIKTSASPKLTTFFEVPAVQDALLNLLRSSDQHLTKGDGSSIQLYRIRK